MVGTDPKVVERLSGGEGVAVSDQPARGRVTLRGVEAFLAIVEAGSLGGAALRLGLGASSLSQQIAKLESALGAPLIDRSSRPVALTSAGRLFLPRARRIMDETARALSELAEGGYAGLETLSIAVIEDLDADVAPALVGWLREGLPRCRIACRTGPSHANLAALADRTVDLSIAADSGVQTADFAAHPLVRDPFVLVTADGLLDGAADQLAVLHASPFISYSATQLMQQQIYRQFRRVHFEPEVECEFDANHAVLAMVVRRRGWTITTALGYLRAPRFHTSLQIRPLPVKGFARTLSLFARKGVHGALPARTADATRRLLAADILPAVRAAAPWLQDGFRIVDVGGGADTADTTDTAATPTD